MKHHHQKDTTSKCKHIVKGFGAIIDIRLSICGHSVIGAILIVVGLYSVLWGKYKEHKEKEAEAITEPIKCCGEQNGRLETVIEDAEANDVEMQKGEACKELRVAIIVPKA